MFVKSNLLRSSSSTRKPSVALAKSQDKRYNKGKCSVGQGANQLRGKAVFRIGAEYADSDRAPNAADAVHGNSTNWIINFNAIYDDDGKYDDDTGNKADDHGARPRHRVCSGRDADCAG